MDYRHELKFIVSDVELKIIEYRLKPLMHTDVQRETAMLFAVSITMTGTIPV
ncbi:MAG: hypothetical protein V8S42_05695 [Lachnospiraceae bacterium]